MISLILEARRNQPDQQKDKSDKVIRHIGHAAGGMMALPVGYAAYNKLRDHEKTRPSGPTELRGPDEIENIKKLHPSYGSPNMTIGDVISGSKRIAQTAKQAGEDISSEYSHIGQKITGAVRGAYRKAINTGDELIGKAATTSDVANALHNLYKVAKQKHADRHPKETQRLEDRNLLKKLFRYDRELAEKYKNWFDEHVK